MLRLSPLGRRARWVVKKWARLASNPPVLNEFSFAGAREPGRKGRRERAGPRLGEGRDGRWTGALEGIVAVAGRLHPRIGTGREPRPESVTRENGQGEANFFFFFKYFIEKFQHLTLFDALFDRFLRLFQDRLSIILINNLCLINSR